MKKKPSKRGAPKGNQNAAKGDTERLPWRLPAEWGIRAAIEKAAKAEKIKPAEVLKAHFGVQNAGAVAPPPQPSASPETAPGG